MNRSFFVCGEAQWCYTHRNERTTTGPKPVSFAFLTYFKKAREEETGHSSSSETNTQFIPAYKPEDCDRLLIEAMEKGDIETTVALYEPDAILFTESGDLMKGRNAIRRHNEEFISLKAKTTIHDIKTTISGDGSIATTRMKCTSVFLDPNTGNQVRLLTNTLEVVRKRPDGTWRFVIDDPFGGTRANKKSQFSWSNSVCLGPMVRTHEKMQVQFRMRLTTEHVSPE